ncbi:MAG TPA: hypothetical protein VNK43_13445 [Gemmatimonadales bacterium]|nr:hypothetical protein [Gemmatimonadales bacterium]
MRYEPASHLTPDDFDAWAEGRLSPEAAAHLVGCDDCLAMLQAEQEVVDELARLPLLSPRAGFADRVVTAMRTEQQLDALLANLPLFSPSPGFAERVIARVVEPQPTWVERVRALPARIFASPRRIAAAATGALALVGSLAWSVLWSLSNRGWMLAWAGSLAERLEAWYWLALGAVTAALAEQPWYAAARDLLATPGRAAAVGLLGLGLYVAGLLALRRLIVAPGPRATHAI